MAGTPSPTAITLPTAYAQLPAAGGSRVFSCGMKTVVSLKPVTEDKLKRLNLYCTCTNMRQLMNAADVQFSKLLEGDAWVEYVQIAASPDDLERARHRRTVGAVERQRPRLELQLEITRVGRSKAARIRKHLEYLAGVRIRARYSDLPAAQ